MRQEGHSAGTGPRSAQRGRSVFRCQQGGRAGQPASGGWRYPGRVKAEEASNWIFHREAWQQELEAANEHRDTAEAAAAGAVKEQAAAEAALAAAGADAAAEGQQPRKLWRPASRRHVPSECSCNAGYAGAVTAISSSPFYSSSCSAVASRANSNGTMCQVTAPATPARQGQRLPSLLAPFTAAQARQCSAQRTQLEATY